MVIVTFKHVIGKYTPQQINYSCRNFLKTSRRSFCNSLSRAVRLLLIRAANDGVT